MSQLLQYYKLFQQNRQAAQTFTPTFEDLTIDDSLSELQRLVRYAKSSIGLQRLVHVKMLAYVASNQPINVVISQIVPLLQIFSNDNEPAIRQNFVEQMIPFGKYCHAQDVAGYRVILDYILPTTSKLLEDSKPEVRHAASIALVEIAKLIHADDLGQHVLTIVLKLAHEDDKEEMRMTASELLNMLAECLGQDLCRQFVIPEVVSLAEDPVFRVRKSTALNFHNICKVGGEHELFERLMPAFVRLSKDDMYRVRRACADSLSEISKYVSDDIRIGVLVEIFLRLAQDPSKLVKQSILQQSGIFISTLPKRVVNDMILGHYCSMANEPTGDMTADAELKHHCAYSFPAVLHTIGSGRWKEVRDVYHVLVQSSSVSVKQTLASSLHEVARILVDGHDLEEELGPIFEEMVQDVEDVQMGVIKNLAVFLSLLPEPCRVSYLPVLHDILHSTNPFNWRLRQYLAIQLSDLIDLPPKADICSMLFPLVMTLLQDPVADVRRDSFKGVSKLIMILYEQTKNEIISRHSTPRGSFCSSEHTSALSSPDNASLAQMLTISSPSSAMMDSSHHNESSSMITPQHHHKRASHDLEAVIRAINTLSRGETYMVRQLWLELAHRLLRDLPRELFEKSFIEGILKLTCDSVTNVRVTVAILLTGWEPDDTAPVAMTPSVSSSKMNDDMNNDTDNITPIKRTTSAQPLDGKPISPWTWLLQRPDIRECISRLARDDHDVYYNLLKVSHHFPDITFEKISCRGMKIAPGGNQPIHYSGLTKEMEIDLDFEGGDDNDRPSLMLSPLDLSDPTNAHILHTDASPRTSLTGARPFMPIEGESVSMDNVTEEGFEEYMDTLDMGPRHG